MQIKVKYCFISFSLGKIRMSNVREDVVQQEPLHILEGG